MTRQHSYAFPPPWHPLYAELAMFLGMEHFRPEWCTDQDQKVFEEVKLYPDIASFYSQSNILCYQNIAYFLHGWKRKAYVVLFQLGMGALTVLDYGCGGGHDGEWFLHAGFDVTFADLPGRPLDFCQWRLRNHGYEAPVLRIGEDPMPFCNIVWCFDVVEHLPEDEQCVLLDTLATCGNVVIVNLIEDRRADGRIHYPVDREKLIKYVHDAGAYVLQDIHTMDDGNRMSVLVYGRGVTWQKEGNVLVDVWARNIPTVSEEEGHAAPSVPHS